MRRKHKTGVARGRGTTTHPSPPAAASPLWLCILLSPPGADSKTLHPMVLTPGSPLPHPTHPEKHRPRQGQGPTAHPCLGSLGLAFLAQPVRLRRDTKGMEEKEQREAVPLTPFPDARGTRLILRHK